MRELEPALRDGLRELALDLTDGQVGLLLDYVDLIGRWNRVYNLTALRDPVLMLSHHLLDSLAAIPPLLRQLSQNAPDAGAQAPWRLLDVGAGAGLPGVVIAICCPGVEVCCVDAVAKKAAFVQQAALALRLPNLRGLHGRVEAVLGDYDIVCSRAFATLRDFCSWSASALAPGGAWLAMKGRVPEQELAQLPSGVSVFHVEPLIVPGLVAERCIVWLRKSTASA